jgi:hypothetical protein
MLLLTGFAVWLLVAALLGMCLGGAIDHAEESERSEWADAARDVLTSDGAQAVTVQSDATAAA